MEVFCFEGFCFVGFCLEAFCFEGYCLEAFCSEGFCLDSFKKKKKRRERHSVGNENTILNKTWQAFCKFKQRCLLFVVVDNEQLFCTITVNTEKWPICTCCVHWASIFVCFAGKMHLTPTNHFCCCIFLHCFHVESLFTRGFEKDISTQHCVQCLSSSQYLPELLQTPRSAADACTFKILLCEQIYSDQRSVSYQGPVPWNNFPISLRHSKTYTSFKSQLETYQFSQTFQ